MTKPLPERRKIAEQYAERFPLTDAELVVAMDADRLLGSYALLQGEKAAELIEQAQMAIEKEALDSGKPIDWTMYVDEVLRRSGVTPEGRSGDTTAA